MTQREPLAHPRLSIQIDRAIYSLDALSLVFDNYDNPRNLTELQCYGIIEIIGLIKLKLEDAANRASDMEASLYKVNGLYSNIIKEKHGNIDPSSFCMADDASSVVDHPTYPKFYSPASEAEASDARRA